MLLHLFIQRNIASAFAVYIFIESVGSLHSVFEFVATHLFIVGLAGNILRWGRRCYRSILLSSEGNQAFSKSKVLLDIYQER